LFFAVLKPHGLEECHPVAACNQQHRARQFAAIDVTLVDVNQLLQPRAGHPELLGLGDRRRLLRQSATERQDEGDDQQHPN